MTTDAELSRIVRSWLEDGRTRLPDHVLDAVLADIPTTSTAPVLVAAAEDHPRDPHRQVCDGGRRCHGACRHRRQRPATTRAGWTGRHA